MDTRIFLSYARDDDEPFVWRLFEGLKSAGFEHVWFDRVSMPSRQLTFDQEIIDAINACHRLVLVVGPNAIKSSYVPQEWRFAYFKAVKCVNPVVRLNSQNATGRPIDGYQLIPEDLRGPHAEDFREDSQFETHLANLVRQLSDPLPPVGKLVAVPELPPHYLELTDRLKQLREMLLVDLRKPVVVSGAPRRVGLQGMGGIGKSMLACAMAHRPEIRLAFPDGVYWVRLGQQPQVNDLQRTLAVSLGGDGLFEGVELGKEKLRELLAARAALLILDDAWKREDAEAFNVVGYRGRLLLTTRDAGVVTALAARENHYQMQLPTEAEALFILAKASGVALEALPQEAMQIIENCGRLPLALALCGAMVNRAGGGITWTDMLDALREHDLEFLSDTHPSEEQHANIWKTMDVSIRFLPEDQRLRFAELAAFPLNSVPSDEAVATVWEHTASLSPRHSRKLLVDFAQRSLVQMLDERRFTMHDLLHHFAMGIATKQFRSMAVLHQRLLGAYRKVCPNGWQTGPNDGYFFEHLIYHLKMAGNENELRDLLLDFSWLQAKLRVTNPLALIADFDYLPADEDAQGMKSALRLSATVLHRDKLQLHTQLYGRLMGQESKAMHRFLASLLQDRNWLKPLAPSLEQAGGPLRFSLSGHSGRVIAVALSADGAIAVSGSEDGSVRVWNTRTGEELYTLQGHTQRINAVAVTKDGAYAISASDDRTVRVWDLSKGYEVSTLRGHRDVVRAVALTSDSKRIISLSASRSAEQRELKIWDRVSGNELHTLTSNRGEMALVLLADDGKTAIYPLKSETMDLETGGQPPTIKRLAPELISTVISADGRRVITSSERTLKAWDAVQIDDWPILQFLRHAFEELTTEVMAVSVLIGGLRGICGVGDTTLTVWDLSSERKLYLRGHTAPINSVAVTADGMRALSASMDGTLRLWDLKSGEQLLAFEGHTGAVQDVAITARGDMAVSASYDKTVRVWNISSPKEGRPPKRHMGRINHLVTTADDKFVISASADSTLKMWNIASGELVQTLEGHFKSVNAVAISVNGRRAVSASDDYTLRVWNLKSGKLECTIEPHQSWLWDVAMSPDGVTAISNSSALDSYSLKVWDLGAGKELYTLEGHSDVVFSVAMFAGGSCAISASADTTLKVWDLSNGHELYTLLGHAAPVFDVVVSKDGRRAVSISTDEVLKVWELSSGRLLYTRENESAEGSLYTSVRVPGRLHEWVDKWPGRERLFIEGCSEGGGTLTLGSDGNNVLYASKENTINGWNLVSGGRYTLTGHSDQIRWLTMTSDDSRLVSASKDSTVRVWDVETGRQITAFLGDSEMRTCATTRDGSIVIAGEDSGLMHFLRLESDALPEKGS